jgi:ribosomal protein S18 acetylase RimI-like enzyme
MGPVEIRPILADEIEQARAILAASGWSERVGDPAWFRELVERSQVVLVAVEDGKVVGIVRALTDGMSNGYISMLAVDETHRRRGIGASLVRAAMGENRDMTWVLRAARPGLIPFYESLGFRVSQVAMERVRTGA